MKVDKNVGLSVNMVKAGLKKYRVFLVAHGNPKFSAPRP